MTMVLATLTCVILALCTLRISAMESLKYTMNLDFCSGEEPFRTLMNIPIQTCVSECQLRNACKAVNYWRQRKTCGMLLTDAGQMVRQNETKNVCIYIEKSHIQSLLTLSPDYSVCASCNDYEVCDVTVPGCVIRECRSLHIAYATVYGNMLGVGSKVKIVCDDGYNMDPPDSRSICQRNGTWSNVPTCVLVPVTTTTTSTSTTTTSTTSTSTTTTTTTTTPASTTTPLPDCTSSTPLVASVADSQLTASSEWNNYGPEQARLDANSFWASGDDTANEYIQVDLLATKFIEKVTTQGSRYDDNEWTKSYKIKTSLDCINFVTVKTSGGSDRIFPGNTDLDTHVSHFFDPALVARCFRIKVETFQIWPAIRFEIYGCNPNNGQN